MTDHPSCGPVQRLQKAFSDPALLSRISLSKAQLADWLRENPWEDRLHALFPIKKRLTCAGILSACEAFLRELLPAPEEGYLSSAFQYAQNLMFPNEAFSAHAANNSDGALCFLTVLQVLFDCEREALPFDPMMDFAFLSPESLGDKGDAQKYSRFLTLFRQEYVYELLRLGLEVTPYPLLGHVAGVHFIAMSAALGLHRAGLPVNLSLVSTAAAGHDLGKFGCKMPARVPYQHYYYTDRWYAARGMYAAGRIAANHSTWDLELENLSAESLCLIYADFRVKQTRDNGREITTIFSLQDSFDVILQKLDQVDDAKKRRYTFVYGKLRDFEDYMHARGVEPGADGPRPAPPVPRNAALLPPEALTQAMTLCCVDHNLRLMHRINSDRRLGNILEAARSEKSWTQLRAYLIVLEESSVYLSGEQKEKLLTFCYELLMHREGVIRRQSADLLGNLIAHFRLEYRKELPEGEAPVPGEQTPFDLWAHYLELLVYPDHKLTPQYKSRIGYALKLVVHSLMKHCQKTDAKQLLELFLCYCRTPEQLSEETAFVLLNAATSLPAALCEAESLDVLTRFSSYFALNGSQPYLQAAALRFLMQFSEQLPADSACLAQAGSAALAVPCGDSLPLLFLQCRILQNAGLDASRQERRLYDRDVTSEIFRDDLKTAVHWMPKVVSVQFLRDLAETGNPGQVSAISAHLSNLIRVSEWAVLRHNAGKALVAVMPRLSPDQRAEIALELVKSLDSSEYEFFQEIPPYLGELALYLEPEALDELLDRLQELLSSVNDRTVSGALGTAGAILAAFPSCRDRFLQSEEASLRRQKRLLGMLLSGLAHYREAVQQEALLHLGKTVFGSQRLTLPEKAELFSLCAKKLYYLLSDPPQSELSFFYRAAALSHLYRFLSLYRLDCGPLALPPKHKAAFFPGTFDPFTLSHKGIVREIRDLGFEVYLAVDEFSWSKKTQPHLIRRKIVNLSVADEFDVYVFPGEIPVNLSNPRDLLRLGALFPEKELYIVVGSDVVQNASCYQKAPEPGSIHTMNHILFRRQCEGLNSEAAEGTPPPALQGKVLHLRLPADLEDISSTRIRESIDRNRDISSLTDPMVKDYIYENGLYLREPSYKPLQPAKGLWFQEVSLPDEAVEGALCALCKRKNTAFPEHLKKGGSLLLLRDSLEQDRILGALSFQIVACTDLFSVLEDLSLADALRQKTERRLLLITGVELFLTRPFQNIAQWLLTEALCRSLSRECGYALFSPGENGVLKGLRSILRRLGFLPTANGSSLLAADLHAPIVLIQNLETTLKEPLCSDPEVLKAVEKAHNSLLQTLTEFYPGSLVLPIPASLLHQRLVEKVTALNGVPVRPSAPRILGPYMCVPFGKILRGKVMPNTVTKTLHTDKVVSPDSATSRIEAFPYYAPISSQVRVLKSFGRPAVLVDDLLHDGDRMRALDPLFRREEIDIRMVLVGVLSGRGRDLMAAQGHPSDCVYFVPNLRQWFVESTLYPFIGGDTVQRENVPVPGLSPSINRFLPYALPQFSRQLSKAAIFAFSKCCLENAREVFLTLERRYREQFGRNLTLNRLSEAVVLPLCPDKGSRVSYDPNLPVSEYLKNDLEMLMRMRDLMME